MVKVLREGEKVSYRLTFGYHLNGVWTHLKDTHFGESMKTFSFQRGLAEARRPKLNVSGAIPLARALTLVKRR